MNKRIFNWIEIDRNKILSNIRNLRRQAGPKVALAAAVKANAYGHGLTEIVSILNKSDVKYLALHSTSEANAARAAGWVRNIMLVGPVAPDDFDAIIRLDLEPTIFEVSSIARLGRLLKKSKLKGKIHLKLETGTHRQGLLPDELNKTIGELKKFPEITVAGVSTHFANIEDTTDHSYAMSQLEQFKKMVAAIKKGGIKPRRLHTACSAALLLFKDTYFGIARPGIAVYGYWPSKETYVSYRLSGGKNSILQPALSLYSRISQIKTIPADSFIGYGCTYRTSSRSRIAVLPIGYSDGIDRRLSNLGYVLIKGRRAPIRGRVCMNLVMVDVTDISGAKLYDKATLIGCDGDEKISADLHAGWCQTINYEILSRLSPLLPRYIV
jgi:alanine racemase